MAMPEEVRNLCRLADISAKSLLLQVVRQETPEKMTRLIEKIASQGGATRQQLREAVAKPKAGRPKHYVFAYRPPTKAFNLKLQFHEEPREPRRGHRRARSDHPGPAQGPVGSSGLGLRAPDAAASRSAGRGLRTSWASGAARSRSRRRPSFARRLAGRERLRSDRASRRDVGLRERWQSMRAGTPGWKRSPGPHRNKPSSTHAMPAGRHRR